MQELEKILEEIDDLIEKYMSGDVPLGMQDMCAGMKKAQEIIRKHMNDGWVSVVEELPPFGERLQATILHHEWISDYDADWVPEEEKTRHPAHTEVCEIVSIGAMWFYSCNEDDYEKDVAYINPTKDLSHPISEIMAWRPMPEPYRPERSDNHDGK